MDWVYHIIHGWVVSHEVDNFVWVIFGGFHVWGESTTRALIEQRKGSKLQFWLFASSTWSYISFTYSARPRVGDLPSVCHPLIVGPLLVSKRAVEDHADVSHGVDAHRWAFKHGSVEKAENKLNSRATWWICAPRRLPLGELWPSPVLPAYSAGHFEDTQTHSLIGLGRVEPSDTMTYKHPRSAALGLLQLGGGRTMFVPPFRGLCH